MNFKTILALVVVAASLAGCETSPLQQVDAALGSMLKTEGAPKPRTQAPAAPVAAVAAPAPIRSPQVQREAMAPTKLVTGAPTKADPTGLVGMPITLKPLPKNSDQNLQVYGNGYYNCGGFLTGVNYNVAITTLRKGLKSACPQFGKVLIAVEVSSPGNRKSLVLTDVMELAVPKGYDVNHTCEGASFAVALDNWDTNTGRTTKHASAWNVIGNKFVPVANLKAVSCANQGSGD